MIDLRHENVVSLTDAIEHLPHRRGGKHGDSKPIHVATMYRWAQKGCRGIRLETLQIGGTRCTSIEAMQRFFERLSAAASGEQPAPRTPRQRTAAAAKANTELAKAGW